MLVSSMGDWVPPGVAAGDRDDPVPSAGPADWIPADLPAPSAQLPSLDRKRSTVTQVPPELVAAAPAESSAPADAELARALSAMARALDETRAETKRLREQLSAQARISPPVAASPPPPASQPPAVAAPPPSAPQPPAVAAPPPSAPQPPAAPAPASPAAAGASPPRTAAAAAPTGVVNLNTASVDELATLPGITRRGAQQIADFRAARGPFESVAALHDVPGFHAARVARLSGHATV